LLNLEESILTMVSKSANGEVPLNQTENLILALANLKEGSRNKLDAFVSKIAKKLGIPVSMSAGPPATSSEEWLLI
jgi:hypothetical protein